MADNMDWDDDAGFDDADDAGWKEDDEDAGGWDDEPSAKDASEDPGDPLPSFNREKSYKVLKVPQIASQRNVLIDKVAELFDVTKVDAASLLNHFRWKLQDLEDAMFKDRQKTLRQAGITLVKDNDVNMAKDMSGETMVQCELYCDEVPIENAFALSCGHYICEDCWAGYLHSQISSGPNAIFTTCPAMRCTKAHSHMMGCKCSELVPQEVFAKFCTPEEVEKYERWTVNTFVDCNKSIKWCPRPGCRYAVEYKSGGSKTITCVCSHQFCFGCGSEPHQPVPCDLFSKWLDLAGARSKAGVDKATEQFLAARTKKCPNCSVPIQKDRFCNHMRCVSCNHHFCWLCKLPWTGHTDYYSCTKYAADVAKGAQSEEEVKMKQSNTYMQKFLWHQARFENCKQGVSACAKLLEKVEAAEKKGVVGPCYWLVEAIKQLTECHRMLQWSYCLVYFFKACGKKDLFEKNQAELAMRADRFHELLESTSVEELFSKHMKKVKTEAEQLVKVSKGAFFSGDFEDIIGWEADNVTKAWACVACTMVNEDPEAKNCSTCFACRLHGEPDCRASTCKRREGH